jgi:GntR family transcriptional regulator
MVNSKLIMQIRIASDDGVPIYIQIVNQLNRLVASGRLAPGDELPSIRVFAEQLMVNRNTVARAYLELEQMGIVTKHKGAGTYVSEVRTPLLQPKKIKFPASRTDAIKLMAWAKPKTAVVLGVAALVAAGTSTTFVSQTRA